VFNTTDPTSCGVNNGTITSTVTGGTAPYVYSWSNGQVTSAISGLSGGSYVLTVTDAAGCVATQTVNITTLSSPTVSISGSNPSGCGTGDGSISLSITGGSSPYSFSWNNGSDTQNLSNLSSGTYTVTVTDANGCVVTAVFELTESNPPVITLSAVDPSGCGVNDGVINATVNGGVSPYSYLWNNGATTASIGNLSSGLYELTVTDANGCSATVFESISSSAAPSLSITTEDATCYGSSDGLAVVTPSGGTSPYSYAWEDGSTTSFQNGLSSGDYLVVVTDAGGCSVSEIVSISSPAEIGFNFYVGDITCPGQSNGTIEGTITGGTSPYAYSWSNGVNTVNIGDLSEGDYSLEVTDANGCEADSVFTLVVTGSAPQTGSIIGLNQVPVLSSQTYSVSESLGSVYNWTSLNGNVVSGQGSNVVTVQWGNAGQGQLSVVETIASGCIGDTVSIAVTIGETTGIVSSNDDQSIKVYPNPTNGEFTIDLGSYSGTVQTELFDISGRSLTKGSQEKMTLTNYPDGLYFLRVILDNKTEEIRLIKQ
jgi:hypothetical protein